jgi:hypothetical protein
MNDLSKILEELNFGAPFSSIPSPESVAGPSPSNSQAGPKTEKSGPALAPASPSPRRAKVKASKTKGTCGPISFGSSPSAALQRSLENRLRARLDVNGSLEYELTWKHWDTESDAPICALRASARRTSVSVYIGLRTSLMDGWRSPNASDPQGGTFDILRAIREGLSPKLKLRDDVQLAGWPTVKATDEKNKRTMEGAKRERERKGTSTPDLFTATMLAGWPTPLRQNGEKAGMPPETRAGHHLGLQDQVRGVITELFLVPTGRRVVLAPEFSLWLMGFPAAWVTAAPGVKDWLEAQAALESEYLKDLETQSSPGWPPNS